MIITAMMLAFQIFRMDEVDILEKACLDMRQGVMVISMGRSVILEMLLKLFWIEKEESWDFVEMDSDKELPFRITDFYRIVMV